MESIFREELRTRHFIPGLLIAFVAMAEEALPLAGRDRVSSVMTEFPRDERTPQGRPVNTLVLNVGDRKIRLRPYYNLAEHVFIHELRRYDYPNMAPHATQAWPQHTDLLEAVFAGSPRERRAIANIAWDAILELPAYGRRSSAEASPRPFAVILDDFPNTQPGEPAGAVLQGLAFAYYRADSPNVTIETGKVGAGSRRTGRVADIDGWNGAELVLSIEVKDEELVSTEDSALDGFLANLSEWPDATAIVVARAASEEVIGALADQHVSVLTRPLMHSAVIRWDLNKQKLAAREFHYFLVRVQRHSSLTDRFETFLRDRGIQL